jgi:hypothetical protein
VSYRWGEDVRGCGQAVVGHAPVDAPRAGLPDRAVGDPERFPWVAGRTPVSALLSTTHAMW